MGVPELWSRIIVTEESLYPRDRVEAFVKHFLSLKKNYPLAFHLSFPTIYIPDTILQLFLDHHETWKIARFTSCGASWLSKLVDHKTPLLEELEIITPDSATLPDSKTIAAVLRQSPNLRTFSLPFHAVVFEQLLRYTCS